MFFGGAVRARSAAQHSSSSRRCGDLRASAGDTISPSRIMNHAASEHQIYLSRGKTLPVLVPNLPQRALHPQPSSSSSNRGNLSRASSPAQSLRPLDQSPKTAWQKEEPFQIVVKRARFVTAHSGIGAQFYLGKYIEFLFAFIVGKNNKGKSQFPVLLLFLINSKVDKVEKQHFSLEFEGLGLNIG